MNSSISVVIPLHNQARYLFRAVSSAYWQLGPNDDIIIVNDASTDLDHNRGGIGPFMDRTVWLDNPVNKGVSFSRNRAILHSSKQWIKFLDADDVLAPYALNCVHHEDEIPEAVKVLAGCCHRMVDNRYYDLFDGAEGNMAFILNMNPMLPSATLVRRDALLEVGLFDERIDFEEDWDLWLKLHRRFGASAFAFTPQPLCYYWIEQSDRELSNRTRTRKVDGIDVREYFRQQYGANPE